MFFKKMMQCLVVLSLLAVPSISIASDFNTIGSVVVSGLRSKYKDSSMHWHTHICLSNTTDTPITCKITVYDQDGNDITASYGILYKAQGVGYPSMLELDYDHDTFEIPALGTRVYQFYLSDTVHHTIGFAIVEWTSENAVIRKAISATVRNINLYNGEYTESEYPVNGGEIF